MNLDQYNYGGGENVMPATWDPAGQPFRPGPFPMTTPPQVTAVLASTSPAWGSQSPLTPADTRWGWVPSAAIAIGALLMFGGARRRHNPEYRRNIDAFTDARGVIRPIRGSSGYDEDVEKIDQEEREREEQRERYRGVERGRETIQRPPWAKGFSQERIEQIARDAGRSPYEETWWQGARLYPGTGEYKSAVLEGLSPRKRAAVEHRGRAHAPRSREERIAQRAEARRVVQRAGEDLPF